jgi:hypothetical protein
MDLFFRCEMGKIKRSRKRKVRWVESKPHGVIQDLTCIVPSNVPFVTWLLCGRVACVAFYSPRPLSAERLSYCWWKSAPTNRRAHI